MIGTGINLTTHSADYRLHNKSQTTLTCIRRAACCTACCTATQCAKTSDLCQDSLVLHCEISHINTPAPVLGEESAAALSMQYTTHDTIQPACLHQKSTTLHHNTSHKAPPPVSGNTRAEPQLLLWSPGPLAAPRPALPVR